MQALRYIEYTCIIHNYYSLVLVHLINIHGGHMIAHLILTINIRCNTVVSKHKCSRNAVDEVFVIAP